jgi:hypothetical protein
MARQRGVGNRGQPDPGAHEREMRAAHGMKLWAHFAVITLGAWQLAAPWTLGYQDPGNFGVRVAAVTAERGLAPALERAGWLAASDTASGVLLILFGALSLAWRHRWAQWGTCFTGLWLLFAPLVFWSPDAASYANDTLVGALAITFSILVPMMPGMSHAAMMQQEDVPPGWDYSPSAWSQRLPIIALAFVGFFIARYLAAFQLGHIAAVWDPFFGDGTARIITSEVSRAWPVADAGLGATSYLLEALSGIMGDRRRWRTMPWMVGMFGVLVIPLGSVSIFFIVIQPIVIGTWCTLCLVSAAAMVIMLPYSFDEIVAMGQFMLRARRERRSLWQALWHGGAMDGARPTPGPPLEWSVPALRRALAQAAFAPRGLLACAAIGVWLMFTRLSLEASGTMADSDHLVGALVITISISALAECVRPLRLLNLPLGAWLLAAPFVLEGASGSGTAGSLLAGALLIALSLPRGPMRWGYAGWDRALVW